jgi:NADH-quinone oxidoreductase subunit N
MTISMLALAGIPATAGFMGKFYLIDASVQGGYTWLGVAIVIGSMISLGYYLPVIAAMWMRSSEAGEARPGTPSPGGRPVLAGGSPELDDVSAGVRARPQAEVLLVAVLAGAATIFFGVIPEPLFDLVRHAGGALGSLL